jgi:OOP family OmpA-OmpF porin
MKFNMRLNAPLLCLGLGLSASGHAAEPGWYVVGFGGESSMGASLSEMDENLVDIFESGGAEVVDATSTLDDSDTGFGIVGGYQLNDHFAFEFGYVDLGSLHYSASATISDGVEQAVADVALESSASGPVVTVLGILPIGERFSVFGRAGLSLMNAEGTARITIDGETGRASQSSQKTDPVLGAGVDFSVSKYFAIRLAWDRYLDVGTENVSGDIDADLFSLGIRMGGGWFR